MRARKFQAVEIELDAKSVIHLLLNNGVSFADCAPIIDNCRNLLNKLHLWKIQHYYREMNAYVDKLYPFNRFFVWKTLVSHKVAQKKPQLAHVVSYGWWRGGPPIPLHQPQPITWASCDFFYATLCGTRRTLFVSKTVSMWSCLIFLMQDLSSLFFNPHPPPKKKKIHEDELDPQN